MIIKPKIRSNVLTNAHPKGCELFVKQQIEETQSLPNIKGPKNVLIIGGSSGYGLASRIALAFSGGANTINVSYEAPPKGKRTGTAGWWNNIAFNQQAKALASTHKDFVGDAFSKAMKEDVIQYIKTELGTVDLVIYSLAAGARKDETTGDLVKSSIKTLGLPTTGRTIDIAKQRIETLTVEPGSQTDVDHTVFVMGGSDWSDWIDAMLKADVLAKQAKTISYTYVGGESTKTIYRDGTIGKAKEDLEQHAKSIHERLQSELEGEALISSSKAVVTKASVFIPQMPIYVSCLYDVMMKEKTHESILSHKHRLFNHMVYGDARLVDSEGRLRIDHEEMKSQTQSNTVQLMEDLSDDDFLKLHGTKIMLKDFYQMNGFDFDSIDYDQDVDMSYYETLTLN